MSASAFSVKRPETILGHAHARMRKPIHILAALAVCALISGCMTAGVGDRSLGQGLDDATAGTSVKMRLSAADGAGFADVDVAVANGAMLLTGAVPSQEHRAAAELIARTASSVHTIYNELVVGQRGDFSRSAADSLIASRIRARLAASGDVSSINVSIEVSQGAVYLLGTAHSELELRRAAEIASVVPGVTRVVSFMQLREGRASYAQRTPPTPVYEGAPEPELAGGTRY